MSWIKVVNASEATNELKKIYDEIEEKLKGLSPAKILGVIEELLHGDTLTEKQRRELLELRRMIEEEIRQQNEAAHVLSEKGPQMLKMLHESLKRNNLTEEERRDLERTVSTLAGYQMSFWLPTTLLRKILMFLFLVIGIFGIFQWSPWLGSGARRPAETAPSRRTNRGRPRDWSTGAQERTTRPSAGPRQMTAASGVG